jgi:hypothetical protein
LVVGRGAVVGGEVFDGFPSAPKLTEQKAESNVIRQIACFISLFIVIFLYFPRRLHPE